MTAETLVVPTKPPGVRQIAAVVVGNALEFYDFVTYAFFAAQIGRTFFPSKDPSVGLLLSLATFGVGFGMRPVGALVIGRLGDRVGRRPAMVLSFSLMGLGVLGVSLTPSYAAIGGAAPVLVVLFRMLQGFALGGEVGPSTSFLLESAPPAKRARFVSYQYAGADAAILAAGAVGFVLSSTLSAQALDDWGWRAALLLGASIVPVGLLLRRGLVEPPPAVSTEAEGPPGQAVRAVAVLGFLLLASGTVASYGMSYLNTYAQTTLGLKVSTAFLSTLVLGIMSVTADLLSGRLADRFGRKPVMTVATAGLALSILPCFAIMSAVRSPAALLGATAWMAFLQCMSAGPILVAVAEALPRRIRSGALAIVYALAISVFGGSTQFVIALLIRVTGNPLAPAWYMTAFALVGVAAMFGLRETAPHLRTWRGERRPRPRSPRAA